MKTYTNESVYAAAQRRVSDVFDNFERIYVSFSGGKDSAVMLNLVVDEARRRGRLPVDTFFVDLEAQYAHTIDFITRVMDSDDIRGHWVCYPLHLRNAVSQHQPHWVCWDPAMREGWVRDLPLRQDVERVFDWATPGMEFEDFVKAWGVNHAAGVPTACFVGIRSDESLNRYRTIASTTKKKWGDRHWSTAVTPHVTNIYPIYDWRTADVWTANGREGWDYNRIYDLMHMAGVGIHQQRLCQPYGDDQRRGLWLFKVLEPSTWAKVVARVEGANFGNRHASGRILGHLRLIKPDAHTWESYAHFLLASMPAHAAEHYKGKIAKFLAWHDQNTGGVVPDEADPKLEAARKAPSWRRICKVLLKNDWWCKGLSFAQTKNEMARQARLIAKYMRL